MSWKTEYEGTDELRFFEELTRVPRPSRHMDRIREYLLGFADAHGLEHEVDEAGNVLVRRRGTGRTIVLQGHMDIVATTTSDHSFDFVNLPLETYVENGWIHARNTTLGGDDGGRLALMMCALSDPSLEGADLECLFTVDEEIGLVGAGRMRSGWLRGRVLVNLDSEDVNEITIGSAGSTDIVASFSYPRSEDPDVAYSVEVEGLRGGHSAMEIDKRRGNAILMVADLLRRMKGARISEIRGGSASNVIPMTASVTFTVPSRTDVDGIFDAYTSEYLSLVDEPGLVVSLRQGTCQDAWSAQDTSDFLEALCTCPNGAMEFDEYGVMTSSNIGVVEGDCNVVIKPRSSDYGRLLSLVDGIRALFERAGAVVPVPEVFPAWKESQDSGLVATASRVYRECFGREPRIVVTHGGLESSTIKSKHPGMEAISIGPTILGAHTPDECMDLRTLTEMKRYLFRLIEVLSS
ncbi:MAG: M20/M25/M40 family metallo-hydrolase [archaeon]|nr:M20/M25/M40 family metallo-hydrolase [archaeon]